MARSFALLSGICLALAGSVAARPVYDLAPVDAATAELVAAYDLEGASLRLGRGGTVVHERLHGGYGPDTRVAIASASLESARLAATRM